MHRVYSSVKISLPTYVHFLLYLSLINHFYPNWKTQQPMKRGKSFTLEQDVAICNARLNIFQDPFNVVSKPQYNFWDRIYQNYVELTGDQNVRSQCSVQSRWKLIFGSCKKIHDCLARVEDKQSGLTESNKVRIRTFLFPSNNFSQILIFFLAVSNNNPLLTSLNPH